MTIYYINGWHQVSLMLYLINFNTSFFSNFSVSKQRLNLFNLSNCSLYCLACNFGFSIFVCENPIRIYHLAAFIKSHIIIAVTVNIRNIYSSTVQFIIIQFWILLSQNNKRYYRYIFDVRTLNSLFFCLSYDLEHKVRDWPLNFVFISYVLILSFCGWPSILMQPNCKQGSSEWCSRHMSW